MARILVIEDEDGLRRILVRALNAEGYEVQEAKNGKEALKLHGTTEAELVITDLFMPEMDGMEVLMALRKQSPNLKVIAISGGGSLYNPDEALKVAWKLGAHAAIDKPFELNLFLRKVQEALAA